MGGESPDFVRTSNAAAITLDLIPGRFYRDAKLYCINLLLTYDSSCGGSCAYCGLARNRGGGDSFIRVGWPTYPLEDIVSRMKDVAHAKRVCVSMITHPRAFEDTVTVVEKIRAESGILISALITPTLVNSRQQYERLESAGCDWVGIAVDAATEGLFDRLRGKGVSGPHTWRTYWDSIKTASEVFDGNISVHLVVGIGETDEEMVSAIQKSVDANAVAHLFSFYPEQGSLMQDEKQPPLIRYRRMQLANNLISSGKARAEDMEFEDGRLTGFGLSEREVRKTVEAGKAFVTNGCTDCDGNVACNRPYSNCTPSQAKDFGPRNFPFNPDDEDLAVIKRDLTDDGLISSS